MQVNQVNEAGTYKINGLGGAETAIYNLSDNMLKQVHAREDAKQKHIEEREDTAYERAVESARRAGINPNLIDIKPLESSGGLNNATTMDSSLLNTKMNNVFEEQQAEAQREFERIMAMDEHEREKEIQRIQNEFDKVYKDMEMIIKNRDSIWGNINNSVGTLAQFAHISSLAGLIKKAGAW